MGEKQVCNLENIIHARIVMLQDSVQRDVAKMFNYMHGGKAIDFMKHKQLEAQIKYDKIRIDELMSILVENGKDK